MDVNDKCFYWHDIVQYSMFNRLLELQGIKWRIDTACEVKSCVELSLLKLYWYNKKTSDCSS